MLSERLAERSALLVEHRRRVKDFARALPPDRGARSGAIRALNRPFRGYGNRLGD